MLAYEPGKISLWLFAIQEGIIVLFETCPEGHSWSSCLKVFCFSVIPILLSEPLICFVSSELWAPPEACSVPHGVLLLPSCSRCSYRVLDLYFRF